LPVDPVPLRPEKTFDGPPGPSGLPSPRRIEDAIRWTEPDPSRPANAIELNMSTALAMVSGQNPKIAYAAQRYSEAYARLEIARALWLPSIRAGVSYNKHEGRLQSSDGTILDASRGSLYSGLGAQAVGTGSPAAAGLAARFHITDAIFQPRIANRAAAARQEASRATTNDVLLDTAIAYLNLLEAAQNQAIAEETLDHAKELADLTATFARAGQGPQADADRAAAELALRKNEVTRAEEAIKVASARLNEYLHVGPTATPLPQEPTVVPIELVPPATSAGDLLALGLSNRPELAESQHLVGEAVHRYRREKYAPLLPSAYLGVSYGGFGGGKGSTVDDFGDRFDFDAVAYWELRNFGFGERAARDEARARYQQARLQSIETMDQVAREILEADAQVDARQTEMPVAESAIQAATDSYRRNMERIRAGEGLPIEVLQSIQALAQARREYLRTVVGYNEAQFRLHRALGWPIQ
jgi:outer membrane protein TolC